jgi:hypothetical protein
MVLVVDGLDGAEVKVESPDQVFAQRRRLADSRPVAEVGERRVAIPQCIFGPTAGVLHADGVQIRLPGFPVQAAAPQLVVWMFGKQGVNGRLHLADPLGGTRRRGKRPERFQRADRNLQPILLPTTFGPDHVVRKRAGPFEPLRHHLLLLPPLALGNLIGHAQVGLDQHGLGRPPHVGLTRRRRFAGNLDRLLIELDRRAGVSGGGAWLDRSQAGKHQQRLGLDVWRDVR